MPEVHLSPRPSTTSSYAFFLCLFAVLSAVSCDLSKEVEIDLPEYTPQPVVECYLTPGEPFALSLTRSYAYFDPFGLDTAFLQNTFLQGAQVQIRFNGKTISLANSPYAAYEPRKIFNYYSSEIVPDSPGVQFELNITLADGGQIAGKTTMISKVEWDSSVVQRSDSDTLMYRVLNYMTDDLSTTNYYRRIMSINRVDTVPEQDFLVVDDLNETGVFVFGTSYQLKIEYRVYCTLVHLPKDYHDFLESVQLAQAGNQNPFQQPSPIKSNVYGTADPLGIFTCLVYDRDVVDVR